MASGPQPSINGAPWNVLPWNGSRPPAAGPTYAGAYPDASRATWALATTAPDPDQSTWTVKEG